MSVPLVVSGTLLRGTLHASLTHVHSHGPTTLAPLDSSDAASATATPPVAATPAPGGEGRGGGGGGSGAGYVLGPDAAGQWAAVSILSIKYKELAVTTAEAGQSATYCLRVHDPTFKLRRGMVLREVRSDQVGVASDGSAGGLAERGGEAQARGQRNEQDKEDEEVQTEAEEVEVETEAAEEVQTEAETEAETEAAAAEAGFGPGAVVWDLEAVVRVVQLPNAVPVGTEVVLHCVAVKQSAKLLAVSELPRGGGEEDGLGGGGGGRSNGAPPAPLEKLRPGAGEVRMRFRFVHAAEFVRVGTPLVFRDGSAGDSVAVGVGRVVRIGS